MSLHEVKVPMLPESVADATVLTWHKKPGDTVARDENLVDLETDKVVLEVPAPSDGVLAEVLKGEGDTVLANDVIAKLDSSASAAAAPAGNGKATDKAPMPQADESAPITTATEGASPATSPSVRRMLDEHGIDIHAIKGSGKGGRIVKEDVERHVRAMGKAAAPAASAAQSKAPVDMPLGARTEKRVPMSRLRARIAERLLAAQHDAAILTTFNEVNLTEVMKLRKQYRDSFEKAHGIRLGFMSFFAKASIEALKRFPEVNASIDGKDVVYHGYYDIGIAVSTDRGLVVPVVRDADQLSMAQFEHKLVEYGGKARDGQLTMEEMTGGTFTITNGGVFGSLLSTPILNPPQSGILGMHTIQERPMVVDGEIKICPMMYIALSYDHRIIDGKTSVQFLVTLKNMLEDPARLLLDV